MTRRTPSGKRDPARGASGAVYPISLCMIVRNEERFLRDALASVEGIVDEICIVDTGSTDGTVAIAESFGARIEYISWRDDFAWARNASLAMATGAWILVLDADERLMPSSRDAVRALRGVAPDGRGRWLRCRNYTDSARELVSSTNALIRIFPNDPAIRYRGTLHEFVAREGEETSLGGELTSIEIVHHGYTHEIMTARSKAVRNLRVSRKAFEDAPDDAAVVYNYAMSALLANELDVARDQLERVLELTRGTPRGFRPTALTKLSGVYTDQQRFDDALTVADECLTFVPKFPDGHFARGKALVGLGRLNEAREAFGRVIEYGQRDTFEHFVTDDELPLWKAHNEIGATLVTEGRFAEAQQWLDLALKARPAERTLILNRAKCRESQGDLEDALASFRAVMDGFHDEPAAIEYVNFVFRHGSPEIVLAAVEQALPILGEDYQQAFLASAAAGMLRAGRRDDAVALVRRVLTVGNQAPKGRAIITSLAQQYGMPELKDLLLSDLPREITVTGRRQ